MTKLMEIPDGLQTYFLTETIGDTLPEVRREGTRVIIPVFVRKTTNGYRYFELPVPFDGGDLDYDALCLRQYAVLRSAFYAEPAQSEMRDDHIWEAHRLAVRAAFPKIEAGTEVAAERFSEIKSAFWQAVDAACAAVNKTRSDLPSYFTAETMLTFAASNGMTQAEIATYTSQFAIVSLNLLQNNRNWEELFHEN